MLKLLMDNLHSGLRERFQRAVASKGFEQDDVEAGRRFVHRYVDFIHYADGVYRALRSTAGGRTTWRRSKTVCFC